MIETVESRNLQPVDRMNQVIVKSSQLLGQQQARFLVDQYYVWQEQRIAATLRSRELDKTGQPSDVIAWSRDQTEILELQLARALRWYAEAQPLGVWMSSITGIGPVITAGLLSVIDWETTNTAGRVWKFAGVTPDSIWEKGQKRPWNPFLKTLFYKIGESFVKMQGRETDFYGQWYAGRKAHEWERNLRGYLASQAAEKLGKYNISKSSNAYQWYTGRVDSVWARAIIEGNESFPASLPAASLLPVDALGSGMLPPAHIHSRARRWVSKLFISHCVDVSFWLHHGQLAPAPYVIGHLGHVDFIFPPNMHVVEDLRPGFTAALVERYGPMIPRNQKPMQFYMGEDLAEGQDSEPSE